VILLDTNVLVYAVDTDAPAHGPCHDVVERAMAGRLDAALVPQVLLEFYAVVTSPRRVRAPLSPADGMAQVEDWRRTIAVHQPTARCLDELAALTTRLRRVGQEVHDLFLVAQMRAHGIRDICTVNAADFAGIGGIRVRAPETV
jgi:uncharacterized protein